MDRPLFFLGLFAAVTGALVLFVVIPAQHIQPIMSTVSPDFYPNIGTIIFLIGGIGLTLTSIRADKKSVKIEETTRILKFCALMAILFTITLIAFHYLNFVAGGVILVAASMILLGERRAYHIILVSTIAPVLIWLFIDILLGRSLP